MGSCGSCRESAAAGRSSAAKGAIEAWTLTRRRARGRRILRAQDCRVRGRSHHRARRSHSRVRSQARIQFLIVRFRWARVKNTFNKTKAIVDIGNTPLADTRTMDFVGAFLRALELSDAGRPLWGFRPAIIWSTSSKRCAANSLCGGE